MADDNENVPSKASANEIASLNFKNLIGGPLNAVIDAQINASNNTLAFVNSLKDDEGRIQTATFAYKKLVQSGGHPTEQDMELSVPLLTMLPIPFLRIDYVNLKFNVNITSVTSSENASENKTDVDVKAGGGFLFCHVDMETHISNQRTHKDTGEEKRTFSMEVQVHAVQEPMPGGMERVLTLLEHCIGEKLKG